jgi:hypothetical protein
MDEQASRPRLVGATNQTEDPATAGRPIRAVRAIRGQDPVGTGTMDFPWATNLRTWPLRISCTGSAVADPCVVMVRTEAMKHVTGQMARWAQPAGRSGGRGRVRSGVARPGGAVLISYLPTERLFDRRVSRPAWPCPSSLGPIGFGMKSSKKQKQSGKVPSHGVVRDARI